MKTYSEKNLCQHASN